MKKTILFLLIVTIFTSCKNSISFNIPFKIPAEINIDSTNKVLGIVNRCDSKSPCPGDPSFYDFLVDSKEALRVWAADEQCDFQSEISPITIRAVKSNLNSSYFFEEVAYIDSLMPRHKGNYKNPPVKLSQGEVYVICTLNGVDALFALEVFENKKKIYWSKEKTNDDKLGPDGKPRQIELITAEMSVKLYIVWTFYDLQYKNVHTFKKRYSKSYKIKANNEKETKKDLLKRLPSYSSVVKDLADDGGYECANLIAPMYDAEKVKIYVRGDSLLEAAGSFVIDEKYSKTLSLYDTLYKTADKRKIKCRALYNTATIYMILGDYDKAIATLRAPNAVKNFYTRRLINTLLKNKKIYDKVMEQTKGR